MLAVTTLTIVERGGVCGLLEAVCAMDEIPSVRCVTERWKRGRSATLGPPGPYRAGQVAHSSVPRYVAFKRCRVYGGSTHGRTGKYGASAHQSDALARVTSWPTQLGSR